MQVLLDIILWVCSLLFVITVVQVVRYRLQHRAQVAFHKYLVTELMWTVIPFILLAVLVWPAVVSVRHVQPTAVHAKVP